ncbi:MAG TPA: tetratricopeptide repeat protein [Thermoanaerobaculia bacterium]|jgi:tetratricopeptide (TPR) repeat protein|nr:tetratricopeptide repeat protein [Thermoanaerobaculia bacterium]
MKTLALLSLLSLLSLLPGVQPIPAPSLEGLEPEVAAQLRDARALVEAITVPAELAEAYGELGRLYHAYSLSEAAAAAYANAALLAPKDFRWHYYSGYLQQAMGHSDEAEVSYERALELQPGFLPGWIHLAEILLAGNHPDDAERILKQVLGSDPRNAPARAGLGEIALSRRQFREAAEHLEAALAAAPEADRLHHPLALAYRGLGDMDRARDHLAKAGRVGVRPADPLIDELAQLRQGEMAHLLRGRVAFRFGRYADAAAEFRKAVEARPASVPARINLGAALVQTDDRRGAVEQLQEALKLAPDNGTAHYNLALLLAKDGYDADAVKHLEEAVRIEPRDGAAHLELAQALERTGKSAAALIHYEKAAGLLPQDERAWMGEANLLVGSQRYREARNVLEAAQGNIPGSGRIVHGLARLLAAAPDPALRDGKRAVELAMQVQAARSTATYIETVALALAESGRCDEAAEWQRKAIEAARQEGPPERVPPMEKELARYAAGAPCRPGVG